MTENEERVEELKNAIIQMVSISEDAVMEKDFEWLDNAGAEIIKRLDELGEYKAIGTVEEFKALKEKAEPRICNMSGDGYADGHLVYDTYQCPNCGKEYELEYEEHEYCPECGQHMCIKYEQEE